MSFLLASQYKRMAARPTHRLGIALIRGSLFFAAYAAGYQPWQPEVLRAQPVGARTLADRSYSNDSAIRSNSAIKKLGQLLG